MPTVQFDPGTFALRSGMLPLDHCHYIIHCSGRFPVLLAWLIQWVSD